MEPAVDVHHLAEYPREVERDLVPVDVVLGQVHQVVDASALDVLHDEDALLRFLHLRCRPTR